MSNREVLRLFAKRMAHETLRVGLCVAFLLLSFYAWSLVAEAVQAPITEQLAQCTIGRTEAQAAIAQRDEAIKQLRAELASRRDIMGALEGE